MSDDLKLFMKMYQQASKTKLSGKAECYSLKPLSAFVSNENYKGMHTHEDHSGVKHTCAHTSSVVNLGLSQGYSSRTPSYVDFKFDLAGDGYFDSIDIPGAKGNRAIDIHSVCIENLRVMVNDKFVPFEEPRVSTNDVVDMELDEEYYEDGVFVYTSSEERAIQAMFQQDVDEARNMHEVGERELFVGSLFKEGFKSLRAKPAPGLGSTVRVDFPAYSGRGVELVVAVQNILTEAFSSEEHVELRAFEGEPVDISDKKLACLHVDVDPSSKLMTHYAVYFPSAYDADVFLSYASNIRSTHRKSKTDEKTTWTDLVSFTGECEKTGTPCVYVEALGNPQRPVQVLQKDLKRNSEVACIKYKPLDIHLKTMKDYYHTHNANKGAVSLKIGVQTTPSESVKIFGTMRVQAAVSVASKSKATTEHTSSA